MGTKERERRNNDNVVTREESSLPVPSSPSLFLLLLLLAFKRTWRLGFVKEKRKEGKWWQESEIRSTLLHQLLHALSSTFRHKRI